MRLEFTGKYLTVLGCFIKGYIFTEGAQRNLPLLQSIFIQCLKAIFVILGSFYHMIAKIRISIERMTFLVIILLSVAWMIRCLLKLKKLVNKCGKKTSPTPEQSSCE